MKRKLTATLAMMSLAFFAATAQNADKNLSWDIYPDTLGGNRRRRTNTTYASGNGENQDRQKERRWNVLRNLAYQRTSRRQTAI